MPNKVLSIAWDNTAVFWLFGVLIAVPWAYPKEPLYWVGLCVFLSSLIFFKLHKGDIRRTSYILIFAALMICMNIFTPFREHVSLINVLGGLLTLLVFCASYTIRDTKSFFSGYLFVIKVYAIATLTLLIALQPYAMGVFMFLSSDARMWGDGLLPEWPNVFCTFLSFGTFLLWLSKDYKWMFLVSLAAIVTTSRIALVALSIIGVLELFKRITIKRALVVLITGVGGILLYDLVSADIYWAEYLTERLFKTSDRLVILNSLSATFYENPFGIGNIPYEIIGEGYISYHSTFLKVLVRYGVLGLIFLLLILWPKNFILRWDASYFGFFLFLWIVGLFQDMLFHLHIAFLYAVLLRHREQDLTIGPFKN